VLDATGPRVGAARLWRELHAADPLLELYAPANLADPSFVAGLGGAAAVAHVTQPVYEPLSDDDAAVRRFIRAFRSAYGRVPTAQARYGYEAMRGVLAAIRRAEAAADGPVTRHAVTRAYFATTVRGGVLGPYAIESDGDTTLDRWGAFRVVGGELRFAGGVPAGSAAEG
jgi:hypothetical protein